MLRKLIPKKIKTAVRGEIKRIVSEIGRPPPTPFELKFFPYSWPDKDYVIPNEPSSALAKGPDGLPVPPANLWVEYGKDAAEYLEWGEIHFNEMMKIIENDGVRLDPGNRALDFGCAAGRMLRFLKPYAEDCEIWGCDISAKHICWNRQHLSPPFHFLTNTTIPHLPFEDGYFDLIYSGSVFTHIDDLAEAWLQELRRILGPGGRLFITIHDYHTIQLLETKYRERGFAKFVDANALFQENKDKLGMLVLARETYNMVFFHIDYFTKMVAPYFDVKAVVEEAYSYQTGVLLEKKK